VEGIWRVALMHELVRDLPVAMLGNGGGSGEQKQRLGNARARLKNPNVLTLGGCSLLLHVVTSLIINIYI
jgi:ABC-type multidrug transport system fused ATPase/permease subunit